MAGMLPGVECARRRRFHQARFLDLQSARIDRNLNRRWNASLFEINQDHYHQCQVSHHHQHSQQSVTNITMRSQPQPEQKDDNKLHEAALEARERLEERLRASLLVNKRYDPFQHRSWPHDYSNINNEEHRMTSLQNEVRVANSRDGHSFDGLATEARRLTDLSSQNFKPSSPGLSKSCIDLIQKKIFTPVRKTKGKFWRKTKLRASEQEDCPVCLESFQTDQVLLCLPCTHRFHSDCLIPWLDSHGHCPYCRMKISIKTS